jgi:hypothetical protein
MLSTVGRVAIGGTTYPGLTMNLQNCITASAEKIACAVLHETIHVFQRLQGRHASHTADFFQEAARMGLSENGPAEGSQAEKFVQEVSCQFPGLATDLQAIWNTTIVQPRSGDAAFFTDYHNHRHPQS